MLLESAMHGVDGGVVAVLVDVMLPKPTRDRVLELWSRAIPHRWIEGVHSEVRLLDCHRHRCLGPSLMGEDIEALQVLVRNLDGCRSSWKCIGCEVHSAPCGQRHPGQGVHLVFDAQLSQSSKICYMGWTDEVC